jgi:hypothetical protein
MQTLAAESSMGAAARCSATTHTQTLTICAKICKRRGLALARTTRRAWRRVRKGSWRGLGVAFACACFCAAAAGAGVEEEGPEVEEGEKEKRPMMRGGRGRWWWWWWWWWWWS